MGCDGCVVGVWGFDGEPPLSFGHFPRTAGETLPPIRPGHTPLASLRLLAPLSFHERGVLCCGLFRVKGVSVETVAPGA